MPENADYAKAWGAGNSTVFDRASWMAELPAPSTAYPSADTLPMEMSVVFQFGAGSTGLEPYDRFNIDLGGGEKIELILLGSVPGSDGSMIFGFDISVGRVVLLGLNRGTLELVNSSLAAFVEFLYQFALFIDADRGLPGREERARRLREKLAAYDPGAFVDPDSWWNVVLSSLAA
ncbi:SUKH-4 family immunity protein [Nocardia sp. JW2]|uniref:SUKH-4 family immunity protein n=1 Tax=Nocardia sp. JW2 TaxID=3450738 RepID=UPI003F428993